MMSKTTSKTVPIHDNVFDVLFDVVFDVIFYVILYYIFDDSFHVVFDMVFQVKFFNRVDAYGYQHPCHKQEEEEGYQHPASHASRFTTWTEARAFPIDAQNATCLLSAKDIVRTIEILPGKDDSGTEDFIKSIKRATLRCSQLDLLLDFKIAEKIQDQAKRSIRFIPINHYDATNA